MIVETVSLRDLESKLSEGFVVVKENIIAGKVRTVVVAKEGNALQWLEDDNKARNERISAMSKTEKRIYFSTTGNPPALPGDLRSLTVPGVNESLPSVNRSKFSEKEAFDETHPKPKSFGLGLQVPRCLDTQVSPKGAVWSDSATSWGGPPRVGPATRESGVGRTFVR